jgi:hypothetical protein
LYKRAKGSVRQGENIPTAIIVMAYAAIIVAKFINWVPGFPDVG